MSTIANGVALPRTGGSRRWLWPIAATLGGLLLLGAIWYPLMLRAMVDDNTRPPNLDVSRTRVSAQGLYRGTYTPALDPLTTDKLHSWTP